MNKNVFIGIDVSKETLDFCIKENETERFVKTNNQPKEIRQTFKPFKNKQVIVCMENTGRYNHYLYKVLSAFDFRVYVVHPQHIKQSIGFVRGKNDKIDALRICKFIIKNHDELDVWKPNSKAIDYLKILMTERKSLITNRKKAKVQIKELQIINTSYVKTIIKAKKDDIAYFNNRIAQIEKMIRELIKQDAGLQDNFKRITSIPGVGEVTAWFFIIKTNGFTRLTDPRKLGSYAGVVPFEHQSGTSIITKPRVSKKADKDLKSALQMCAMRAIRLENNDFEKYYKRRVQEGKNPMSVLNAIRNKIIHVVLALINNKTFYQNRLVLS